MEIIREQQNVPDSMPAFLGDEHPDGDGDKVADEGASSRLQDDDDSTDSREVSVSRCSLLSFPNPA